MRRRRALARAACDIRIAADVATFVPGFIGIGLVPDSGGSRFIHRLLGVARAFEWMTSNRRLTAAEAHAWGLVSEVTEADQFAARAAEVAETYAALPTRGVGMTKRLFDHADTASLEAQLELEAELQQERRDRRLRERVCRPSGRSGRRASAAPSPPVGAHFTRARISSSSGKRPCCLLREQEPTVGEHVELALLARGDRRGNPLAFSTAARLAARRS